MSPVLAFDVYGTLIDTAGVVERLRALGVDHAPGFSDAWRQKQLEYAFRRAAMGAYQDFTACTRHALDYVCALRGVELAAGERDDLMALYLRLPPFPEAEGALFSLRRAEYPLYAFSNGPRRDLETLLGQAGLAEHFVDLVSVDEVRSFKPDPRVYRHMLKRVGGTPGRTWLVSSNPFDLVGAGSLGLPTAWVRRSPALPFDPWGPAPTVTVSDLSRLEAAVGAA
jgi:2-haloacid dehalogenase